MRNFVLATVLAAATLAAHAAPAADKPAATVQTVKAAKGSKAAQPAQKAFGLTESLAVLFTCPAARFDNANIIALGGVVSENKKRIDAAPVSARMDLMTQLVAEETAKANAYAKAHKVDCERDAQPAATYWNKMIAKVAAEQGAGEVEAVPARPAAPVNRTPTAPVSGLQLP